MKVGLQIPIFNHLNTLKDRTPVLPYVIRPLIYEESLEQIAAIEEYLPAHAFAQVYGTFPLASLRLDYAAYVGNGPNVRTNENAQQSGTDSTNTVLLGTRVGLRYGELKAGVSATRDVVNSFQGLAARLSTDVENLTGLPRIRLGADLRYVWGPLAFEGELIHVRYEEELDAVNFDKTFYYGTLSWLLRERWTLYGTYWVTREHRSEPPPADASEILPSDIPTFTITNEAPSFGLRYMLGDRIALKGQYTYVRRTTDNPRVVVGDGLSSYTLAVSVFF